MDIPRSAVLQALDALGIDSDMVKRVELTPEQVLVEVYCDDVRSWTTHVYDVVDADAAGTDTAPASNTVACAPDAVSTALKPVLYVLQPGTITVNGGPMYIGVRQLREAYGVYDQAVILGSEYARHPGFYDTHYRIKHLRPRADGKYEKVQ